MCQIPQFYTDKLAHLLRLLDYSLFDSEKSLRIERKGMQSWRKKGMGYFDRKGQFFKTGREATASDLAGLLGQIGEGESLAPGIAQTLIDKRAEIERLFAEHDAMMEVENAPGDDVLATVTKLPRSVS